MNGKPGAEGEGQPGRRAGTTLAKAQYLHKVSRVGLLTLAQVSQWFNDCQASPQRSGRSEVKPQQVQSARQDHYQQGTSIFTAKPRRGPQALVWA